MKTSIHQALVVVHAEPRSGNAFNLQKLVLLATDNSVAFTLYHHEMDKGPEDYETGQVMVVSTPPFTLPLPVSSEDRAIAVHVALTKVGYHCVSYLPPPEQDVFEAFKRSFPEAFATDAEGELAKKREAKAGGMSEDFDPSRN